jgi:hypothetical protein
MKALAAGLAVALVALSLAGGKLWRDLGAERARNAEMTAQLQAAADTPRPAAAAPQPAGDTPQPVMPPAAQAVVQPAPGGASGAAPTTAATIAMQARSAMESARQLFATPEGQEFQRTIVRQMLAQQHPDLQSALGLTPEQAKALFELLVKQQTANSLESMQLLDQASDPAAQQELFRRMDAVERANAREIEALLGPKYEQWQQYQRAASDRQREQMQQQQSQQLRAAVSSARNPLSDAQFESLFTALKAEERRIDVESGGQSMQQQLDGVAARNKRLTTVAADYLNAEQLAQYQAFLERQAATMRAMMGMAGATEGIGAGPSTPPPPGN